ncbi:hypothetical protein [Polynucleobacter sp. MWH-UH2A]|uniref:hypothetical protein n=1 Tax=Polynucleobacter sp. MWH-UH2A TaxID=1855617 RepID=UPI001BFD2141|nr:hypothetical protein [Polynucleobacter sp. MWH-UH2A]QWD63857.1 hypothetical protein IC571_09265 [Polynucleobacter sp. MWH-UH2A]
MSSYEILSIENAGGKYWVVTYKLSNGQTEIETIDALDHHEAFVKFRNLMIEQQKSRK